MTELVEPIGKLKTPIFTHGQYVSVSKVQLFLIEVAELMT
jgi:hypothetical protein